MNPELQLHEKALESIQGIVKVIKQMQDEIENINERLEKLE